MECVTNLINTFTVDNLDELLPVTLKAINVQLECYQSMIVIHLRRAMAAKKAAATGDKAAEKAMNSDIDSAKYLVANLEQARKSNASQLEEAWTGLVKARRAGYAESNCPTKEEERYVNANGSEGWKQVFWFFKDPHSNRRWEVNVLDSNLWLLIPPFQWLDFRQFAQEAAEVYLRSLRTWMSENAEAAMRALYPEYQECIMALRLKSD